MGGGGRVGSDVGLGAVVGVSAIVAGLVGVGRSGGGGAAVGTSVAGLVGMLVRANKTCVASRSGVGEAAGAGRLHDESRVSNAREMQRGQNMVFIGLFLQ